MRPILGNNFSLSRSSCGHNIQVLTGAKNWIVLLTVDALGKIFYVLFMKTLSSGWFSKSHYWTLATALSHLKSHTRKSSQLKLPREVLGALSLWVFNTKLDGSLSDLNWCKVSLPFMEREWVSLSIMGRWNLRSLPTQTVLGFYEIYILHRFNLPLLLFSFSSIYWSKR